MLPSGTRRPLFSPWEIVAYALIIIIGAALRISCFVGLGRNDDIGYSDAAQILAQGNYPHYPLGSILGMRSGMVAPIALFYRLFGVFEWSAAIFPLTCSIAAILMTMLLARILAGRRAAVISGLILALFPLDVAYSTQLVPSVPLAPLLTASIICLILAARNSSYRWAAAAGFLYGLTWLVNEQTIICLPIFICFAIGQYFFCPDRRRDSLFQYMFAAIAGLAVVLLEMAVLNILTGSYTWRFNVSNSLLSVISTNTSYWYYPRTFFKVWNIVYDTGEGYFGIFWYFFIPAAIYLPRKRCRECYFLIASIVAIVLYLEFGVMSANFQPIAKWIRYLVMLSPLTVIVVGSAFDRLFQELELPDSAGLINRLKLAAGTAVLLLLLVSNLYFSIRSADSARKQVEPFKNLYRYLALQNFQQPIYLDSGSGDYLKSYSNRTLNLRPLHDYDYSVIQNSIIVEGSPYWEKSFRTDNSDLQKLAEVPFFSGSPEFGHWRIYRAESGIIPLLSSSRIAGSSEDCFSGSASLAAPGSCNAVKTDPGNDLVCRTERQTPDFQEAAEITRAAVWRTPKLLILEMEVLRAPKEDPLTDIFLTYYWLINVDGDLSTGRQDDRSGTELIIRLTKQAVVWQVHVEYFGEAGGRHLDLNSYFEVSDNSAAIYLPLDKLPVKFSPAATWHGAAVIDSIKGRGSQSCFDKIGDPAERPSGSEG